MPSRIAIPGHISWPKLLLALAFWGLLVGLGGGLSAGIPTTWTWRPPPPPPGQQIHVNRQDQCEKLNYITHVDDTSFTAKVFEPQNTWSNAGYLLAGILILLCSQMPLGLAVGGSLCLLAVLSGLYHATLQSSTSTPPGDFDAQMLDVVGIYLVLLILLFYGVQSVLIRRRIIVGEIAAILVSLVAGYIMAENRTNVCLFNSTTAVIIFVCLLVLLCARQMIALGFDWRSVLRFWRLFDRYNPSEQSNATLLRRYFWGGLFVAGLSFFFRLNDGDTNSLCLPDGMLNFLQAHASWHVLSALALLIGYDFLAWGSRETDWADFGVLSLGDPQTWVKAKYANATTAGLLAAFGIFFLLDAVLKLHFVFQGPQDNPARCEPTGIVIGIVFLVGAGLMGLLMLVRVVES